MPFRTVALISALLMLASGPARIASAYEPVSAFEDGFAVPSPGYLSESGYAWPGVEAMLTGPYAAIAWQVPFGMEELAVTTAQAGTAVGRAGFSVSFSGTGFDLYGDEQEKAGISYRLRDSLSAGLRVTRSAMRIQGFGAAAAFSADAGVIWRPAESVILAFAAEDLAGATLGDLREPLDGALRLSVSTRLAEQFTLFAGARKVRLRDTSVSAGFLAKVAGPLTVGAGFGMVPDRVEFLAAIDLGTLRFAYRGGWHPDLGMSHGGSLAWGEE